MERERGFYRIATHSRIAIGSPSSSRSRGFAKDAAGEVPQEAEGMAARRLIASSAATR